MVQKGGFEAFYGVTGLATASFSRRAAFTEFVQYNEPHLRRALVAVYGSDLGREAVAEALAWGWQHWDRLIGMENPTGYLFRVGQTYARRILRRRRLRWWTHEVHVSDSPRVEPGLPAALGALTSRQRAVVVLVHGYEMTHAEAAELLGIRRSTVQNHLERGMAKLREMLEVSDE